MIKNTSGENLNRSKKIDGNLNLTLLIYTIIIARIILNRRSMSNTSKNNNK